MRDMRAAQLLIARIALGAAIVCASTMLPEAEPTAPAPAATKTDAPKPAPTAKTDSPKPAEASNTQAPKKPADPGKDAPAAAKPEAPAEQSATANQPAPAGGDEEKLPPPPSGADKKASPQRFTPSEQVRADFDVSFPIDI